MHEVVIVGSGFGGAVAACRLAAAGREVLVLERGRRWEPEDYPRKLGDPWRYDHRRPHRRNGWFDLRFLDNDMVVVTGAGVGGGSLVYANVCVDAPPEVFDTGWPAQVGADELEPYFERVAEMLRPNRIPAAQEPERVRLMREAAVAMGAAPRFTTLDLAVTFRADADLATAQRPRYRLNEHGKLQGTCTHCGQCDVGCKTQAKNTLDLNYLAVAQRSGATIRPLTVVRSLRRGRHGWQLQVDDISSGRPVRDVVEAERVILAAGSIGSTEILLHSRRELPNLPRSLGKGWSSNGDFVTPATYARRAIGPTKGPTITSAIDFLDGADGARCFIEDGGLPNIYRLVADAPRGPVGRWLSRRAELDSVMPWFGQAIDAADGDFYVGRSMWRPWSRRLRLNWNPQRSTEAIDGMAALHRAMSQETGGRPLPRLAWSWFRWLVTPHPLGGCNMGASPGVGVVDHAGRVFGHDGLYVMDGAVVPRAIGRNPSKTIAAVAERASELLLAEAGIR